MRRRSGHISTIFRDLFVNSVTLLREQNNEALLPGHAGDMMVGLDPLQMEAVMEHLFFVCPTTRQEVDSGVESEITTLLRIRQQTIRAQCPACGQWHEWPVRDAILAKAA
jgi:hypothetical protein